MVFGTPHLGKTIWDFWAPRYERLWAQYYSLRPSRELVHRHLDQVAPEAEHILDLGCGIGQLAQELAMRRPNVRITAVDPSAAMIHQAQKDYPHPAITYRIGQVEDLVPEEPFQVIISNHSFPYMSDQQAALGKMHQLLVPGGRVLITHANAETLLDRITLGMVRLTTTPSRYLPANLVMAMIQQEGFTPGETIRLPVKRHLPFHIPTITMTEGIK